MKTVTRVLLPAMLAIPVFAQLEPLPLVPGSKVITLWPPGAATLKGLDQKEVFTITPGMPDRVQKVVNIHNPSIEWHLAPAGKANGVGIILAAGGGSTDITRLRRLGNRLLGAVVNLSHGTHYSDLC